MNKIGKSIMRGFALMGASEMAKVNPTSAAIIMKDIMNDTENR